MNLRRHAGKISCKTCPLTELDRVYTIKELLDRTSQYLTEQGLMNARLEAQLLLGAVLNMERVQLFMDLQRPLQNEEVTRFRALVVRRVNGEPAAYIAKKKAFYRWDFTVTPDVLIPRPDSEHLVEEALRRMPEAGSVLDIGTGSGCLAVSLALLLEPAITVAVDISAGALAVAEENGRRIFTEEGRGDCPVLFVLSDIYEKIDQKFDLIVSNPPYITADEYQKLERNVKEYEPRIALEAGEDGLDCYRRIISEAPGYLNRDGLLLLEVSDTVADGVEQLAAEAGFSAVETVPDLSGHRRVAVIRKC